MWGVSCFHKHGFVKVFQNANLISVFKICINYFFLDIFITLYLIINGGSKFDCRFCGVYLNRCTPSQKLSIKVFCLCKFLKTTISLSFWNVKNFVFFCMLNWFSSSVHEIKTKVITLLYSVWFKFYFYVQSLVYP